MKRAILITIVAMVIISSVAIAEVQDKAPKDVNQKILKSKNPKENVDVIITLKDIATDTNIEKVKSKIGNIKINAKDWNEVYPNGFAATITREQMETLRGDPSVERVDIDEIQTIMLDTANKWSGSAKARATAPTGFGVDGDRNGNKNSYTSTDVVIAILDTGIDPKHTDLTGENNGGTKKIIGWNDTINSIATPYDDQGHGTHVASIAAGDGDSNPLYKGVAPGAALVGVKVCTSGGSCPTSKVITGINWAVANKALYGIRIMSLSLGGIGASDGTDPESAALNNAVDKGIVVTVAAGNSGPIKYTVSSPGAAAKVITVGAIADPGIITGTPLRTGLRDNGFYLAYFSSRGPTSNNKIKPDIVAPGVDIMAAKNIYPNSATFHGGYIEHSGTSMATPFAAGVAALMLDANYTLIPIQVKNIIRSTGEDYGVTGCDIDYGCGRMRAYRAVKMAVTGINDGIGDQLVPTHKRYSAYINDSTTLKSYPITITSTGYPYASTLIMTDWSGLVPYWENYGLIDAAIDLDLYVKDPSGTNVGTSEDIFRQETVVVRPSSIGAYKTNVSNFLGGGYYTLDISYK